MAASRVYVGVLVTGLMAWRGAAASFHIEAGEAWATLNEWSRQSTEQVLFDFPTTYGLNTLPVDCECTSDEALELLLLGSTLTYQRVNDRTVAVLRPAPAPSEPPVSSEELARLLRGFEPVAQSYAEGKGPRGPNIILILPPQAHAEALASSQ